VKNTKIPIASMALLRVCLYSRDSVQFCLRHLGANHRKSANTQSIIFSPFTLAHHAANLELVSIVEFPVIVLSEERDSGAGQSVGLA
jgi:hypothetical protein